MYLSYGAIFKSLQNAACSYILLISWRMLDHTSQNDTGESKLNLDLTKKRYKGLFFEKEIKRVQISRPFICYSIRDKASRAHYA